MHTKQDRTNSTDVSCACSQRWILGYIGFLFGMVFTILRTDINIAIVCMAGDVSDPIDANNVTGDNHTADVYDVLKQHPTNASVEGNCATDIETSRNDIVPEFTWDRTIQSHVLSAYYYGFVASQIPCGWFIGKFGGKMVVTWFMGLASLTTLLIPVLARTHVYAVVAARILVGLASAPLPAAWVSLVGKWALSDERSRMMMVFWLGQTLGAAFGYGTSGFLCAYGFDNGWGSIFYLHGVLGFVFILLWVYFTSNSPETHPRISEAEKKLLSKSRVVVSAKEGGFFKVPWKKVFTTVSVWAIFVTHLCDNIVYFLIVICLPLFVKEILRFDIKRNGIYSALPVLTTAASLVSAAILADFINSKHIVSRTTNRKIFQLTSFLVSSAFLVLSSYMSCDQRHIVILLFCICTFFQSIALSAAYPCNLVDMTPSFAGYLYGVSNTIGATSGFIVPLVVASLTRHKTIQEWQFVFWITAGISVLGSVVYGLFSTSEPVSWDVVLNHEIDITVEQNKSFIKQINGVEKENILLDSVRYDEEEEEEEVVIEK